MSQAALNVREREAGQESQRVNRTQQAGLLFLLVVLATIVWIGWVVFNWMQDEQRVPVSKLILTGERHYTHDDDVRRAILALGDPGRFMTQDVDIIQQQIKQMPWIKQASIRKQWPDELRVHLVEYSPAAYWNDEYLLDADGKSFSVPAERLAHLRLPSLSGPAGSGQDVLAGYYAMNQLLGSNKLQLNKLAMTARHSWQLTLSDGVRLELGRDDYLPKLQRFIAVYPLMQQSAKEKNQQIDYIDLRYDTGVAVGWKTGVPP
ncbi:cell division protein FtsQ [Serratia microhaemolytica]|uniref:cell division protein FtsQ n=1 Tax=Serratia microhaemolytica TaxID=2675110 RepID=UPI000FDDD479|nr:cell division protein FtsQ [Serratia microhaemolytica]